MHKETPTQRAGGLRLLRFVTFVNSLGVIATIGLLVLAFNTIQGSREDSIRRACQEQNVRHDRLVRAFNSLYGRSPNARDAARRALLIDAVAPHQDCAARAARLTR